MTNSEKPRLCAGTYFVLILKARRQQMSAKDNLFGKKDGLSEPETLLGLARVVTPDIKDPWPSMEGTIKGNTFDFKSCKNFGGGYFSLDDEDARQEFDNRVKEEYLVELDSMTRFVDRFIDVGGSRKKDIKLTKALLDLIDQDDSIDDDQLLYVCEDGHPMRKSEIRSETHFCLDSFLLGVWHYALLRPEGIEIGRDTFNEWCPSRGGGRREYQGSMGVNLDREITIFRHEIMEQENEDTIDAEETESFKEAESSRTENKELDSQSQVTEQNISNPVVYQFVMNGDHGTQIGKVDNYYAPQKEDQSEQ